MILKGEGQCLISKKHTKKGLLTLIIIYQMTKMEIEIKNVSTFFCK